MRTPRTDAWRVKLAAALSERGAKAELARFLCRDGNSMESRVVQIARVLNQGMTPEPEFVLATIEWMDATAKAKPRRVKSESKNLDGK
ncbi:MAG: hypothetical protein WCF18_25915 [Chthoniobacteraceae bacterium]